MLVSEFMGWNYKVSSNDLALTLKIDRAIRRSRFRQIQRDLIAMAEDGDSDTFVEWAIKAPVEMAWLLREAAPWID